MQALQQVGNLRFFDQAVVCYQAPCGILECGLYALVFAAFYHKLQCSVLDTRIKWSCGGIHLVHGNAAAKEAAQTQEPGLVTDSCTQTIVKNSKPMEQNVHLAQLPNAALDTGWQCEFATKFS